MCLERGGYRVKYNRRRRRCYKRRGGNILKDIDPKEVKEARKLEEQGVQEILDNEDYSPLEKFFILLAKASRNEPIKLGEKNAVEDETEDIKVYPEGEKQGDQLILRDVDLSLIHI